MEATEIFVFEGLDEQPIREAVLSNTERAALREYAAPGGPIWRIMQASLDYRRTLVHQLAVVDFATAEGNLVARKVQAAIAAVDWHKELWQAQLSGPTDYTPTKSGQASEEIPQ